MAEVDRLAEICRQYETVLLKSNSSRSNARETEYGGCTSSRNMLVDVAHKLEEFREQIDESQAENQLLRTQMHKQEDLLRSAEMEHRLEKTQLELQLRSLRVELDEQTKQRAFYEQENMRYE